MDVMSLIEPFFFLMFATITVVCAACVVTLRNPVHSALFLIATLVQVAALFILLRSPFLAVVQLFIYVGAVMVLFLFVVFLLDVKKMIMDVFRPKHKPLAYLVIFVLLVEMLAVIFVGDLGHLKLAAPGAEVKIEVIGRALFTTYIFPFEIVSVVLLVAMVGAIVMARGRKGEG
ncbi:MAG: NADH-quinone oxidoreductase subunit J [Thermodesulfobacteriota bacterium]